LPVFREASKAQ